MEKLASVIIPTYKRPETLVRSIESVLNQEYKNVEVIVADDNGIGTEYGLKTAEVMKKYENEPRIKYVQHEVNKNGSAARNTGFRASSGDYIFLLDDDDEFTPVKVGAQIKCLEEHDDTFGACYTNYIRVNGKTGKFVSKCGENAEGNLLKQELQRNLFIAAGSNLCVKRSVFEEVGGFNEAFIRNQDMEFLVKILTKYKLAHADVMGLKIYTHAGAKRAETFDQITDKFLKSFEKNIDMLSEKDKKDIYRMINLQRFRSRLTDEKQVKRALSMIKNGDVNLFTAIRYMCHLMMRKVKKVSCGFKL